MKKFNVFPIIALTAIILLLITVFFVIIPRTKDPLSQAETLVEEANLAYEHKEFTDAKNLYEQALNLNPYSEEAHHHLAITLTTLDDKDTKKFYYHTDKAIELYKEHQNSPRYADTFMTGADRAIKDNDFTTAQKYLEQGHKAVPTDSRFPANLSNLYLTQKDYKKAGEWADILLEQNPQESEPLEIIIDYYTHQNQKEELNKFFARNIKKYSDNKKVLENLTYYSKTF